MEFINYIKKLLKDINMSILFLKENMSVLTYSTISWLCIWPVCGYETTTQPLIQVIILTHTKSYNKKFDFLLVIHSIS